MKQNKIATFDISREIQFLLTALVFMAGALYSANARATEMHSKLEMPQLPSVVQTHLEAIKRKDAAEVYQYASVKDQQSYQTPDDYMAMLRTSYRALYDHRSYKILSGWNRDDTHFSKVEFVLYDGSVHTAIMRFKSDKQKTWHLMKAVFLDREAQPI